VFNEHAVLPKLFARLVALFDAQRDCAWRAVLVDDGSRDDSAALVRAQAARDKRFELVELSRNFGFQAALAAGLAHARSADAVVTMDADAARPARSHPRAGRRVARRRRSSARDAPHAADTGLRRAGFDLFHAILGRLSDYPIEPKTGTFGVLGRAAVDAFHQLPERNRFFPGLRAWIGFPTADVPYDRHERAAGKPQQTFRRLVRYALDGVFSFSRLPLRLLTYSGIFVGFVGFCLGLYYVVKRLIKIETAPTGFTTLAALVLFLGGVQLIAIGVLGEYLGRIYDEVKQRPVYLGEAAARLRLIMRGTAATLAAGALLVLFWWMAADRVAQARHDIRAAMHITMLFSGSFKKLVERNRKKQSNDLGRDAQTACKHGGIHIGGPRQSPD